ncbi:MAG: 30S ribosomal protein S21, partial [Flavobacteriales bacterium CG_4_10_14_0_2_um_filter_35_18]
KDLRDRKQFTKPSVSNRAQNIKAAYVQRKRTNEEQA